MTPATAFLLKLCGYDPAIVVRLGVPDRRFFVTASVLSLVAAVTAGVSVAYGAIVTVGVVAAPVLAVAGFLFVLNLLRLHHAGSGYPLHLPIEDIKTWRPAVAAVVVLFVLGVFLTQPLVLLVLRPWLVHDLATRAAEAAAVQQSLGVDVKAPVAAGLIGLSHAAWESHVVAATLLTVFFSILFCLPALLRRTGARAVRLYESERWVDERMFVDDAWADCKDAVVGLLHETAPGFSGELQVHYADPPYNTRPLVFGLDPALLVAGRVRLVRSKVKIDDTPALPWLTPPPAPPTTTTTTAPAARAPAAPAAAVAPAAPPPPPPARAPASVAAPAPPAPAAAAPIAPPPAARTPAPATTTTSAPTMSNTQPLTPQGPSTWAGKTVLSVAKLTANDARTSDDDGLLLFMTIYLEKPRDEIVMALAQAAPDTPLPKVFPEWNKLPTLLLKSAGFAQDAALAPLIAIAVDRPVDQVEKRLRAAPRDKKVSSVFAPELARILLRSGNG